MALNLLAPSDPFGLVQAPAFIWFVADILLVGTLALLARLWWLVRRERCLYQKLSRDLRALRSEYNPVLRDGLPQAAYEAIIQRFEKTPLASVWDGFATQLVTQCDTTGADRFWTSESAAAVFNEASVLEARPNRNFYTAREFTTFDEKLDALIQRRRQLARDFLTPMAGEDTLERELYTDICGTFEGALTPSHSQPLSPEDVRRLSPKHFEALVAALETQHGAHVLLTPYAADGEIDVIAVQSRAIRLVQCKHTQGDTPVEADVIAEIVAAFDGYRARWLATLAPTRSLRPVIVTNGEFTRQAQKAAAERGIELIAARQLWRLLVTSPCTLTNVLTMEDRRLVSIRELPGALRRIWGASSS